MGSGFCTFGSGSFVRGISISAVLWIASALDAADASQAEAIRQSDLGPRSVGSASTLFTVMPSAETGIVAENRYADPRMWGELFQEFKFGAIGTGVALGDYDNDGRLDVFVVSKTETSRLFRNLGGWKFEDVTDRAGLIAKTGAIGRGVAWAKGMLGGKSTDAAAAWQQGASFADINNDGYLDLYVCRFGAPNLLYVNQRDGTFREEAEKRGVAVSDASGVASFCDYDRDGWLDFYLQTNLLNVSTHPKGQPDYLFRNRGDGTFEDVTAKAGIRGETQGHAAIWWDYDEDGWPDLYVANDFATPDFLYRNNGDGTFTDRIDQAAPYTPHSSMGADLGDINNDGHVDLLVADMAATSHEKDHRGMAKVRALLNEHEPSPGVAPQYMRNALFLGTGTPHLMEAAQLAGLHATDWTWSVALHDLDNDGWLDAHFTNGMVRELHNSDLVRRTSATESREEAIKLEKESPLFAEANLVFRNRGDLIFEPAPHWGLGQVGVSFGAAFGDLDTDGDLDLVVANYEQGPTVLRNDAPAGNRIVVALQGTTSNRFGVGALIEVITDMGRQVRPLTAARGYLSSQEPAAHFGLGDAEQIAELRVTWPSGARQVFRNLKANRRYIVTEPSEPARVAHPRPAGASKWFEEVGAAMGLAVVVEEDAVPGSAHQPLIPFRFDRVGPAVAVADLNSDGRPDFVLGGTVAKPARVFLSGPAGKPHAAVDLATTQPRLADDGPVLAFDADNDGHVDLLVTKAGAAFGANTGRAGGKSPGVAERFRPQLWLNDGAGRFALAAPGALPALEISAGAAAAVDFDRDGWMDVFVGGRVLPGRYPHAPDSALLKNQGGRFVDATAEVAPTLRNIGLVTSALWSDFDADGWLDLLVATEWGIVHAFKNEAGQTLHSVSDKLGFAHAGKGWWTSLAGGDFDGDGRIDYVAGNAGLNTPYTSDSAAQPVLFHGSFGPASAPILLEAYEKEGRLLPRRALGEIGSRVPAILKRYPSHDAFARATLPEIVGPERLVAAKRWDAQSFRSGIFTAEQSGRYRFQPLPRLAQISPAQGFAVGDFNADGRCDLYLVQNSHAPIGSVGRFSGGLSQLWLGSARGLEAVSPKESGLVVAGDGQAAAAINLDDKGGPDLLVTQNGAPVLVFRNGLDVSDRGTRIRLLPSRRVTNVAGAQITVTRRQGGRQVAEVYAGSGYFTQGPAEVFFGAADGDENVAVRIRWPNGTETEHPLPRGQRLHLIQASE
jgi:enediyne biosynthesis protein E4